MTGAAAPRVAVIYGGASAEAGVSERSARGVHQALQEAGCRSELIVLTAELPGMLMGNFDVAFPVAHGAFGEDGRLQSVLELIGMPYVGSGVRASAVAAHKPTAKALFREAGLEVARGSVVAACDVSEHSAERLRAELSGAVVVKPASGGSAIGVTRVAAEASAQDLLRALKTAVEGDIAALVEEWRVGDEVTCGVLETGTSDAIALPPTRIQSLSAEWYDFGARYGAGGSRHECPAAYGEELTRKIQQMALGAHRALGARDLSRADFVVDPGSLHVTLLELNTLPGMTPTSNYPEAAAIAGHTMPTLCRGFVERALAREPEPSITVQQMPD